MDPTQSSAIATTSLREKFSIFLVTLLLGGLPVAAWLDAQNLTAKIMEKQATATHAVLTSIRSYYSNNIVAKVLAVHGEGVTPTHNYESTPGGIPLPATLSIDLGRIVNEKQDNVGYRFVSDYPFLHRAQHVLDEFEKSALAAFRVNPDLQELIETHVKGLSSTVRMISPVRMSDSCVSCHNQHPDSPKTDWKVSDVRGIQSVSVSSAIALNLNEVKYSLAYFILAMCIGLYFIVLQRRQNKKISMMNAELEINNSFLASVSLKVSRYLSPQIYKSIFSGELDAKLQTTRKKLTIFFSDVTGFTAMSEDLEPEQLTDMINEYLDAMSEIALKHGGTIDKFIGDAILVFFGDPESKGTVEDARACLKMAIEMQARLAELNLKWGMLGAEEPLRIRIGINTGYCNVGNFGSTERMDYTILGAEANLAARLQSIAEPGTIVVSHETYMLVADDVSAHMLPATAIKGFSREVIPYVIDGIRSTDGSTIPILVEQRRGLHLYLDPSLMDGVRMEEVRSILNQALTTLDKKPESR